MLYALTLVPVGLLADRVDRPKLLAGGITLWSLLTMAASETRSFGQVGGRAGRRLGRAVWSMAGLAGWLAGLPGVQWGFR